MFYNLNPFVISLLVILILVIALITLFIFYILKSRENTELREMNIQIKSDDSREVTFKVLLDENRALARLIKENKGCNNCKVNKL